MTPAEIEALFTREDESFLFARWGRPVAPVVFGVDEAALGVIKSAFQAVATLTGQELGDLDPELGANCMLFFFRDWAELRDVPDLDRLVPDLGDLVVRLEDRGASHYRVFRFDDEGAIQACFIFIRMDEQMSDMPAETLALGEAVQAMLLWCEQAFAEKSPLAMADGVTVLRPEIADLIRVAYDPVLPNVARDVSHALRLSARIGVSG